jgi:hypothetical protein
MAKIESDAKGQRFVRPLAINLVVFKGFGENPVWFEIHLYPLEEPVGMIASKAGLLFVLCGVVGMLASHVLEVINAPNDHFTAGCGTVMGEHLI